MHRGLTYDGEQEAVCFYNTASMSGGGGTAKARQEAGGTGLCAISSPSVSQEASKYKSPWELCARAD